MCLLLPLFSNRHDWGKNHKFLQLGVTKCIAKLIETFNPLQWLDIWLEFNVVEVSLALLTSNYNTGTDLSCQCDLIAICVNILTGKLLPFFDFLENIC